MAVRPIDGNDFMRQLTLDTSKGHYGEFMDGSEVAYTSREIAKFVEDMPTLTPPNEPLTLKELREMDGEPAWWDDGEGSCWGIISVDSAGMWGGIPFLRGRWRQVNFEYNIEERKMRIYRRPPEGEDES